MEPTIESIAAMDDLQMVLSTHTWCLMELHEADYRRVKLGKRELHRLMEACTQRVSYLTRGSRSGDKFGF